ncbi:unnamed protein product [Ambrosiozyma monospora]|uniref:Unnamed protein product n=1 Tax=Ambrosiozyma monospora TaxID=43982 RepID=A0ACB5TYU5_AMBMO|nr:unnamed protein product [Ambrosiozyma monospora]
MYLLKCILINMIPEKEATVYTDIFFQKVHPSYFVFNEIRFRERQHKFFTSVLPNAGVTGQAQDFTTEEICSMYLVWILGRNSLFAGVPNEAFADYDFVPESVMDHYLNLVKICLSGYVFSSTVHSVRLLYLAGLYHETKKKRKISWLLFSNCTLKSVSLGFHQTSVVRQFDPDVQEEIKVVWWSSFRLQVNNCAMLGKLPNFSLHEVDIGLPKLDFVEDELFKEVYFKSVHMMKQIT